MTQVCVHGIGHTRTVTDGGTSQRRDVQRGVFFSPALLSRSLCLQPRRACGHRHRSHAPPTRVPLPAPPVVHTLQRMRRPRAMLRLRIPARPRCCRRSPPDKTRQYASPAGRVGPRGTCQEETGKHTSHSRSSASLTAAAGGGHRRLCTLLIIAARRAQNGRHALAAACVSQPPWLSLVR